MVAWPPQEPVIGKSLTSMTHSLRPADGSGIRLASLPLGEVAENHEQPWCDLADNAAEPNIFYAPPFAPAAVTNLETRQVSALLIWQSRETRGKKGSPEEDRLIGLVPFTRSRWRWGLPVRLMEIWGNPFLASSAPLLRKGEEKLAVAAFLDWLARDRSLTAVRFPELPETDAAAEVLLAALKARTWPHAFTRRWSRALLESDLDPETYLKTRLAGRTRQSLRRKWRRLTEQGPLTFSLHETETSSSEALTKALDTFLELEASGWKGRRGTALACQPELRRFARAAFLTQMGNQGAQIGILRLGDRPIAAAVYLKSGSTAWYYKPAYDETLGKFSPGLLLELAHLEHALTHRDVRHLDSACVPGHPLESLWRERKAMADLLFIPRPEAHKTLARLVNAEGWRQKLIAKAKAAKAHLRRR